jgi:hypothetical protein
MSPDISIFRGRTVPHLKTTDEGKDHNDLPATKNSKVIVESVRTK